MADPRGNTTTSSYDPDNRLTSKTAGANGSTPSTTTYAYDIPPGSDGCVGPPTTAYCTTTKNPKGGTTTDFYDARGDEIQVTRPGGQTTQYGYDLDANRTTMTDGSGRTTAYTYDADNRLTAIDYSDGKTPDVEYTYDADGKRTTMHDGTGTTTYTYNEDGQLTTITDGAGATVEYGYNKTGNVTSLTYPNGKTITKSYDGADRLAAITDWLGHTTTFSYDPDGNDTSTSYPDDDTVKSTYGTTDKLASTSVSHAKKTLASLAYTRDEDELITAESASKLTGTPSYAYNAQNELTGAGSNTFEYDSSGNVTTLSGVHQTFNEEDELTASTATTGATNYSYDSNGDLTTTTPSQGPATDYSYDQAGRLIEVRQVPHAPSVTRLQPSSGPAGGGKVVKITGANLTGATGVTFGGIAATNLKILSAKTITVTSPAGAGTAEVQVTTAGGTSPAVPADLYTYDGTAGGAIREASAHKSQPTQAAPISYSYNGDGLRMSETTVGSTTQFTWDTTPSTPEIIDDGSNYYIYGPGGIPIEQISHAESPNYYFHDALGSTRALLGPTGAVTATYAYNAYGAVTRVTGAATTPLEYGEGYTDATTGLVYLVERYYDPATGQFLTVDPMVDATEQPYAYVGGDPINTVDPDGKFSITALVSGVTSFAQGVAGDLVHGAVGVVEQAQATWDDVHDLAANCGVWYSYACEHAIQVVGVNIAEDVACTPFDGWSGTICSSVAAAVGTFLLDRYGAPVPETGDKPSAATTSQSSSSASGAHTSGSSPPAEC